VGLAICKDTGVAAHAAATVALGCDVYVGGVLETAADAAVQPRRARAIATRHGVWVALSSFAGSTGGGYALAAGESAIWRPDGCVAARATSAVGDLAVATIPGSDGARRSGAEGRSK
jgi:predicted amidohydrolase